ncbi:hypothetical protein B484DRAFT_437877 [Ochromonadaceae sp. CCMP2298]|nr:hypothetical protein B484DRAFT_437877 [Ochromonadaceae sp. CCMP2298]
MPQHGSDGAEVEAQTPLQEQALAQAKARAQAEVPEQAIDDHHTLLSVVWGILAEDEYLVVAAQERDQHLLSIGYKAKEDAEFFTAEEVESLVVMMKPVPRERLERVWADLRALRAVLDA